MGATSNRHVQILPRVADHCSGIGCRNNRQRAIDPGFSIEGGRAACRKAPALPNFCVEPLANGSAVVLIEGEVQGARSTPNVNHGLAILFVTAEEEWLLAARHRRNLKALQSLVVRLSDQLLPDRATTVASIRGTAFAFHVCCAGRWQVCRGSGRRNRCFGRLGMIFNNQGEV